MKYNEAEQIYDKIKNENKLVSGNKTLIDYKTIIKNGEKTTEIKNIISKFDQYYSYIIIIENKESKNYNIFIHILTNSNIKYFYKSINIIIPENFIKEKEKKDVSLSITKNSELNIKDKKKIF
jgi:hypothetical protein